MGEVSAATKDAAEYVRRESRPFLLECETTRLGKLKQGQGDLRTPAEMAELATRDPLKNVHVSPERRLILEAQVEAAIEAALAAPDALWR